MCRALTTCSSNALRLHSQAEALDTTHESHQLRMYVYTYVHVLMYVCFPVQQGNGCHHTKDQRLQSLAQVVIILDIGTLMPNSHGLIVAWGLQHVPDGVGLSALAASRPLMM